MCYYMALAKNIFLGHITPKMMFEYDWSSHLCPPDVPCTARCASGKRPPLDWHRCDLCSIRWSWVLWSKPCASAHGQSEWSACACECQRRSWESFGCCFGSSPRLCLWLRHKSTLCRDQSTVWRKQEKYYRMLQWKYKQGLETDEKLEETLWKCNISVIIVL